MNSEEPIERRDPASPESANRRPHLGALWLALALLAVICVALAVRWTDSTWTDRVREVTAGAERLEIYNVAFANNGDDSLQFAVDGTDEVAALMGTVRIDASSSGEHCLCSGTHAFEFHFADGSRRRFSWHHNSHFRGPGLPGDAHLTGDSIVAFTDALAVHGFRDLKDALAGERAQAAAEAAARDAFFGVFPERVRRQMEMGPKGPSEGDKKRFGDEMAEAMGGKVALAVAVCRALGLSSKEWTGIQQGTETHAIAALSIVDGLSFEAACSSLGDDRVATLGAARVAFHEGLLEALPPDARGRWAARLAGVVLEHGSPGSRKIVLRRLGGVRHPDVAALLERVSSEETSKANDASPVKDEDPGSRASAFLQRGRQGDETARKEIEALLSETPDGPDRAALELSLALLGDASRLSISHYEHDSYTLGYAGIEAIERFEGKAGVDILLQVIEVHAYAAVNEKAAQAFERITGFKPDCKGECRSMRHADQMVQWWKENGAAFIARKRAEAGK